MHCASCGWENPVGAKFCIECAAPFKKRCPSCGTENLPQAKFCSECAAPLLQQLPVASSQSSVASPQPLAPNTQPPFGERRQLTVMFCDLVGSTALSEQLDPEELREVVHAYQTTCAEVINRFEGYIAQYLGDGLLVYFGYPVAHEDDSQRAVRAGLEIVAAVGARHAVPLQVRVGIHTGLVVVGEMGGGGRYEQLALGETPNLAARLQGIAEPDTVVISSATQRLIEGFFQCRDLGPQTLKGISAPTQVFQVLGESAARSRLEVAASAGLTPLVGREEEVGLLLKRWEKVQEGHGQVVLLSGEAGIGKSRLLQVLTERVASEPQIHLECHCSPYYQNTAFYPVIDLLQRVLQFKREDSPEEKLSKLEAAFVGATTGSALRSPEAAAGRSPLHETMPLFASLLSLPLSDRYASLALTPQKQKEKTQQAILSWLLKEAERQPVRFDVEDLHWTDPSTLEFLGLLIDQVPAARLFIVLTFRPEFLPPWSPCSHMTPIALSRLDRTQTEVMVEQAIGSKALPTGVRQQIVSKTDGVPLFVEELTKMVLESGLYVGATHASPLPLGIPTTLQDALMARLDRLGPAKEVAQLGATLGREFSAELLQAVSPLDGETLQRALVKLGEAEILYQRGLPPQATYTFKHALIQDAAYRSLLKSTRQKYHQQIANVLEEEFPETKETQPELVAHHYTEARLATQAISYWQQAGQKAIQRSANLEAISHLTKALELLKTLPDTPERTQQELTLRISLGSPLIVVKGTGAPEVKSTYARALELCRQLGETPQLFPVLWGLRAAYISQGEYQTARELAEQGLGLAQRVQDATFLLLAHMGMGITLYFLGEFAPAREHVEQALALYNPQQHNPRVSRTPQDLGVVSLTYLAWALWFLGYPEQAAQKEHEALALAEQLSHPHSLAWALNLAAKVRLWRREGPAVQAQAEVMLRLADEQGFPYWETEGTMLRGWALAEQGREEEGIAQMREGFTAWRAMGTGVAASYFLSLPIEAYRRRERLEEGFKTLAEAFAVIHKTGERVYEAELYRLKGELVLQSGVRGPESENPSPQHPTPSTQAEAEAEACFLKAIEIARRQQAKSLELRATMSLARLWQQQGRKKEAHQMLAEIYGWFTEGFDTKDLQEAKVLLEELS